MIYSNELIQKMKKYYYSYYHDNLGIPDYKERIEKRLNEEEVIGEQIQMASNISGIVLKAGDKVLVAGAGTGAEVVIFNEMGCEVTAIEPNNFAIEIIKQKLDEKKIVGTSVHECGLENINIESNFFDFIYCWTVIEHVQDLEKSLSEMIRVSKTGGVIFIETPDYRSFYEPHYKIKMPMVLPKVLLKVWLFLKGRPTSFLDSLQFVTSRKLKKIFKRKNVIAMQANLPYPKSFMSKKGPLVRINMFLSDYFEIQSNQIWVVKKECDDE